MDKAAALKKCKLTRTFTETGLKILASVCEERSIERGLAIFNAGEPSKAMFFVASGAVRVFVRQEDGKTADLGTLYGGESLGALSLLGAKTHLVNAEAAEDTLLLEITAEALRKLLEQKPQTALKLLLALTREMGAQLDVLGPELRAFAAEQAQKREKRAEK